MKLRVVRLAATVSVLVVSIASGAVAQTNEQSLLDVVGFLHAYGNRPGPVVQQAIAAQSSTFPIPSSATGFTIVFDRQLGLPKRTSQQFGPLFGDRALTGGGRTVSLALHYQDIQWKKIDGIDLRNGGLVGSVSDPRYATVFLNFRTQLFTASANVGLTDALEVGVAVPVVRASVDGAWADYIPGRVDPTPGLPRELARSSATGIGDVGARAKYTLWRHLGIEPGEHAAMGVLAEVRFPTGKEEELHGTGFRRTSVAFLASGEHARLSEFVNAGYTWGGRGVFDPSTLDRDYPLVFEPSEELKITGGAHVKAGKRFTVGGEVVTRRLFKSARLYKPDPDQVLVQQVDLQLAHAIAGAKVNIAGQMLLSAHVLFPLTDAGLSPGAMAIFGFQLTRGSISR